VIWRRASKHLSHAASANRADNLVPTETDTGHGETAALGQLTCPSFRNCSEHARISRVALGGENPRPRATVSHSCPAVDVVRVGRLCLSNQWRRISWVRMKLDGVLVVP
jgi:hypothetical protein